MEQYPTDSQDRAWQAELLNAYTSVESLYADGFLSLEDARTLAGLGERFRVRIPRYYAGLIERNPALADRCPIRRQAIPNLFENDPVDLPGWAREWSLRAFDRHVPWTQDAIGDIDRMEAARLTHRYDNRAIVHVTSLCGLYCRFCFRKTHLNDGAKTLYDGSLDHALDYVNSRHEIRELILTGGDPLTMTDAWLDGFLKKLAAILHVKHLRIHTRMPVVMPSRITESLCEILMAAEGIRIDVVAHFNHPKELTPEAREAIDLLNSAGIGVYNQSVLMKGVNDDARALYALFETLYDWGVRPFYLHHPDWTEATFGFRVSIEEGKRIYSKLLGHLSGPALPHYVLDVPGGWGKVPVMSHLKLLDSRAENNLKGALYEVSLASSRGDTGLASPRVYADFSWA